MSYPTQNQPQGQGWQQGMNQPNPNVQASGPQGRQQGNTEWQNNLAQARGLGQGAAGRQPQFSQTGQQMMPESGQGGQGQGLQGHGGQRMQGQGGGFTDQPGGAGHGGPGPQRFQQQQQAPGGGMGQAGTYAQGPAGAGGQWDTTGDTGMGAGYGPGGLGVQGGTGQPSMGQRAKGSVEKATGRVTGDQGMTQRGQLRQGDPGNVGQGYGNDPGNF